MDEYGKYIECRECVEKICGKFTKTPEYFRKVADEYKKTPQYNNDIAGYNRQIELTVQAQEQNTTLLIWMIVEVGKGAGL